MKDGLGLQASAEICWSLGESADLGLASAAGRSQGSHDLIDYAASSDCPVLVHGGNGSGQQMVAEAIHARSARANQVFVAMNLSGIPAALAESELFGDELDPTHAMPLRETVFGRASGGTLLLDGITGIPLELQSRLARVLQTNPLPLNVRVIAGTQISPTEALLRGALSEQLNQLFTTATIELPRPNGMLHMPIGATLEQVERNFILATLKHFEGDKRRSAQALGCSLKTLYNKLNAYQREQYADATSSSTP